MVDGVVILAYGFVLGVPLAASRMKAPQAPKHLVTTHLSAIIQGAAHLGLAFAVGFTDLGSGWAVAAAWLIVAGSGFEIAGGTINWLSGTGAERYSGPQQIRAEHKCRCVRRVCPLRCLLGLLDA